MAERYNPTGFLGTSSTPNDAEFSSTKYPGQLAQIVTVDDPARQGRQKEFRLVKLDSSMSTAPYDGAIAWWKDRTTAIVTTSPTALGQGRGAGIFCKAPTSLVNTCVYVQVRGIHNTVKFIDAVTAQPTAAGLLVVPSSTAGKADCLAAGTAATYPILGYSAGVYDAANATCAVDLNVADVSG